MNQYGIPFSQYRQILKNSPFIDVMIVKENQDMRIKVQNQDLQIKDLVSESLVKTSDLESIKETHRKETDSLNCHIQELKLALANMSEKLHSRRFFKSMGKSEHKELTECKRQISNLNLILALSKLDNQKLASENQKLLKSNNLLMIANSNLLKEAILDHELLNSTETFFKHQLTVRNPESTCIEAEILKNWIKDYQLSLSSKLHDAISKFEEKAIDPIMCVKKFVPDIMKSNYVPQPEIYPPKDIVDLKTFVESYQSVILETNKKSSKYLRELSKFKDTMHKQIDALNVQFQANLQFIENIHSNIYALRYKLSNISNLKRLVSVRFAEKSDKEGYGSEIDSINQIVNELGLDWDDFHKATDLRNKIRDDIITFRDAMQETTIVYNDALNMQKSLNLAGQNAASDVKAIRASRSIEADQVTNVNCDERTDASNFNAEDSKETLLSNASNFTLIHTSSTNAAFPNVPKEIGNKASIRNIVLKGFSSVRRRLGVIIRQSPVNKIIKAMNNVVNRNLFSGYKLGSETAEYTLEFYWDYVCPFSAKSFLFVSETVNKYCQETYPGKFAFVFRHQVQPWHPQSTILHEAAIAVHRINPSAFYPFSKVLFTNISEFYDDATYDLSRSQIYDKLSDHAQTVGIEKSEFLAFVKRKTDSGVKNSGNEVTDDLKVIIRISRQNGIHVSPTVLLNGLVDQRISSSWDLDTWISYFKELP